MGFKSDIEIAQEYRMEDIRSIAARAGVILNAVLPGNDYEFDAADGSEAATSSNLQV